MKLIEEKILQDVINVIADSRPTNITSGVVFTVLQELMKLKDAPVFEEKTK